MWCLQDQINLHIINTVSVGDIAALVRAQEGIHHRIPMGRRDVGGVRWNNKSHWVALELRQAALEFSSSLGNPHSRSVSGRLLHQLHFRVTQALLWISPSDLASAWRPKMWELVLRRGPSPCDSWPLNGTSVCFLHLKTIARVTAPAVTEGFEDPEHYVYISLYSWSTTVNEGIIMSLKLLDEIRCLENRMWVASSWDHFADV